MPWHLQKSIHSYKNTVHLDKFVPVQAMKAYGKEEVQFHLFPTSAPKGEGSALGLIHTAGRAEPSRAEPS